MVDRGKWLDYEDSMELFAKAMSTPDWDGPISETNTLETSPLLWKLYPSVVDEAWSKHEVAMLPRHDPNAPENAPFSFIQLHRFSLKRKIFEPLNTMLTDIALSEEKREGGGIDSSNIGGYHGERDLFDKAELASMRGILQDVIKTVERRDIETRDMEGEIVLNIVPEGWLNVAREGNWNQLHTHPGCHYSGRNPEP